MGPAAIVIAKFYVGRSTLQTGGGEARGGQGIPNFLLLIPFTPGSCPFGSPLALASLCRTSIAKYRGK